MRAVHGRQGADRRLTVSFTLLHISTAIATIAIIPARTRWPWNAALMLSIAGVIGTAFAYI
ncbi:MAG: hypothetical protein WA620_01380 [Methylovirgula sp.]